MDWQRTFGLTSELKQLLILYLKYPPSRSRCLRTQPSGSELDPMTPPERSSPYSVELIFEGEAFLAPLLYEVTHDIKGSGIPRFETFRIVQNEKWILV